MDVGVRAGNRQVADEVHVHLLVIGIDRPGAPVPARSPIKLNIISEIEEEAGVVPRGGPRIAAKIVGKKIVMKRDLRIRARGNERAISVLAVDRFGNNAPLDGCISGCSDQRKIFSR